MRPVALIVPAAIALAAGCGPPAEPEAPAGQKPRPEATEVELADLGADHVGFELPPKDVCKTNADGTLKNPIAPDRFDGILRNARCRQEMFLTMAYVSQTLGVDCKYCHVPDPDDPKKEIHHLWTDRKRTANWMYRAFVQGLRPIDGDATMCADCHTDRKTDEPVAKILGEPRDHDFASEWMNGVMASGFRGAGGERLKCSTCHVGMAPGTEDWNPEVIRLLRYDDGFERVEQPLVDPAEVASAETERDEPEEAAEDDEPEDAEPEDDEGSTDASLPEEAIQGGADE